MRTRKKLVSIFLALVMTFSLLPTSALAEGEVAAAQQDQDGNSYYQYDSLENAVAHVIDGGVVRLLSSVSESVTVPAGKTMTLDLNGQTLTGTVTNEGTLTVMDSLGGGMLQGLGSGYALINHGIMVIGTENGENSFTINGGNTGSSLIENGWNLPNGGESEAVMTIYGGSFTGGVNNIKNDEYGNLTIYDCSCTGAAQWAVQNWAKAAIHGGSFKTTAKFYAYAVKCEAGSTTTITGGSFSAPSNARSVFADTGSTVKISGGKYLPTKVGTTNFISKLLISSDYYVSSTKEGGLYPVLPYPLKTNYKSASDGKTYASRYKALSSAISGVTGKNGTNKSVILLTDYTGNGTFPAGYEMTLNLNGKTLTQPADKSYAVSVKGTVTLRGPGNLEGCISLDDAAATLTLANGASVPEVKSGVAGKTVTKSGDTYSLRDIVYAQSVELNEESIMLPVGETQILSAAVLPDNADDTTVVWTSDHPEIAAVDEATGEVTGIAPGTATITATAKDGTGKSGSCAITVVPGSAPVVPKAAAYRVEHYKENLDGTYTLAETEFPLYGELNTQVEATPESYAHYAVDTGVEGTVASGTVVMPSVPAGATEPVILTLKLYYDLVPETITIVDPNGTLENHPSITVDGDGTVAAVQAAEAIGGDFSTPQNTTLTYWRYVGWKFSAEKDGTTDTFNNGTPATTLTQELVDWLSAKIKEGGWALTMDSKTPGVYTPSSGGGSSSGSNTTTTTEKNPDGSTTTTTTDKTTGTVTETTKNTDGSTTTVETKKDGTVTESNKTAEGTTGTVVTDKNGDVTEVSASVSSKAANEAAKTGEAVTLPVEVPTVTDTKDAPAVEVTVPKSAGSVKVEIPVEKVTPGTVAVIVNADGTEKIVSTSVVTENGVALTLDGSATVKVIDNSKDFIDVPVTNVFYNEISSLSAREIMVGKTEDTFDLHNDVTLNQVANVAGRITDAVDVKDFNAGIVWGNENGLKTGNEAATRGEVLKALYVAAGSPAVADTSVLARFNDAASIPADMAAIVAWAAQNGILKGTAAGNADLNVYVTRGQACALASRTMGTLA